MANNGKRDEQAPIMLTAEVKDANGVVWGYVMMTAKEFSKGSVGFHGTGKLVNPANPTARYQVNYQNVLIGSKPA